MQKKNQKKSFKKIVLKSAILLSLFGTGVFVRDGVVYSQSVDMTTQSDIAMKDGTILHAWAWSFNTITENMAAIKEAGYTSVQTSPINAVVVGNGGDKRFTKNWYFHYQPTAYTIGNYQLGTEAEFIEMNRVAEQYGIKIIVDAVLNHTTSDYSKIDNAIKSIPGWTHGNVQIQNWNSREEVTQKSLLGLWEWNTQSPEVQQYLLQFLRHAVADGADGFRYDAAKHIELPGEFGSNFWNVILDNGSEFQYGEILQDSISRDADYANLMSITASNYGHQIRSSLRDRRMNAGNLANYHTNVDPSKLVLWVESHDNYANDEQESTWMSDEDIRLGWAMITARAKGTPLFFSRPVGGGNGVRFPEQSQLGDAGSDLYKDKTVAAVNKFHNAMIGQSEYIRNPSGDEQLVMIERGDKGAVLVNLADFEKQFHSETKLANGTYKDQVSGRTYTVSNGRISGSVSGRSVLVLYNAQPEVQKPTVSVTGYQEGKNTFLSDTLDLTLNASNAQEATYSVNNGAPIAYQSGKVITVGSDAKIGETITLTLTAKDDKGQTTTKSYSFTKEDPNAVTTVYFDNPDNWSEVYAYMYSGKDTILLDKWPGTKMTKDAANGYYTLSIPKSYIAQGAKVLFTNNQGSQYPQTIGFDVRANGLYSKSGLSSVVEVPTASVGLKGQSSTNITIQDKIDLTLQVEHATKATYQLGNGAETSFTDGQTITVGSDLTTGASLDLTLKATGADGQVVTKTYTITKQATETPVEPVENPTGQTSIYFDNPDQWADVYVYMYDAKGAKLLGAWPGTKMTKDARGSYTVAVPSSYQTAGVKVLFSNNQGAQYPQTTGFDFRSEGIYSKDGLKATASVTYKEVKVTEDIPFETQTVENPDLEKGITRTASEGSLGSKEITYKVTYLNGVETSREQIAQKVITEPKPKIVEIGTKEVPVQDKMANRVYFNNAQNWNKVFAYVYDGQGKLLVGAWPGKEMTKDEYGYYIELSSDVVGGKVIFNNPDTKVQYPAQNQAGYTIELGHLYDILGNHQSVLPEEGMTRIRFDNPGGWDAANLYAYYGNPLQTPLGAWPGQAMAKDGNNNFYIDLPEDYATSTVKLLFNKPNSAIQFPVSIGFDFVVDGHYTKDGLK